MADEAKSEAQEDGKGGKGKLILFALLGLLVLGGGGAGAAWFLGFFGGGAEAAGGAEVTNGHEAQATAEAGGHDAPSAHGEAASGEKGGHGAQEGAPPPADGVHFVDLPDILVNLRSSGKRMRYLKLRVSLEVHDPDVASAVRALTPRVMDSIQLYLRSLSVDDVRGAIGMEKLKEEMLARINRAIRPHRVEDVLFKEMLVQ